MKTAIAGDEPNRFTGRLRLMIDAASFLGPMLAAAESAALLCEVLDEFRPPLLWEGDQA